MARAGLFATCHGPWGLIAATTKRHYVDEWPSLRQRTGIDTIDLILDLTERQLLISIKRHDFVIAGFHTDELCTLSLVPSVKSPAAILQPVNPIFIDNVHVCPQF
jgi:hypothetical protein